MQGTAETGSSMAGPSLVGTDIVSYAEIDEILRSQAFEQYQPSRKEFIGGSLLMIDGDEHHSRRRMEAALFTRAAIVHYEREELIPTITEVLDDALGGADAVSVDLVPLVRDMLHRISAGVTGLDGVDTAERVEQFRSHVEKLHFASTVEVATRDPEAVLAEARAARDTFVADFYAPSLERRRALRAAGSELPQDLLGLLVAHDLDDEEFVLAEAVLYLIATVTTTTHAIPHVVRHVLEWVESNPGLAEQRFDAQFVRAAIAESLRLHTPNPILARRATTAVTLASGRGVEPGEVCVLHFGVANREPGVFGADADEFRPERELPGNVKQWGLSFGRGRHTCIGRPLVTGVSSRNDPDQETDGTMVNILGELFARGVSLVPGEAPTKNASSLHDAYSRFPVRIQRETAHARP